MLKGGLNISVGIFMISEQVMSSHYREDEEEEEDSWEYVMKRVNHVDHHMLFDGPIQSLELSADQK